MCETIDVVLKRRLDRKAKLLAKGKFCEIRRFFFCFVDDNLKQSIRTPHCKSHTHVCRSDYALFSIPSEYYTCAFIHILYTLADFDLIIC